MNKSYVTFIRDLRVFWEVNNYIELTWNDPSCSCRRNLRGCPATVVLTKRSWMTPSFQLRPRVASAWESTSQRTTALSQISFWGSSGITRSSLHTFSFQGNEMKRCRVFLLIWFTQQLPNLSFSPQFRIVTKSFPE